MKNGSRLKVLTAAFLLTACYVSAASAAFWDSPKKESKEVKKEAVAEKKAEAVVAASAGIAKKETVSAPASPNIVPVLDIVSPKGDAVSGKFHVEAKLTPDDGFDELFFRVMGDAVCDKDFKRGDKYEADCDTGKAANGTSFILQAQAFNKSKSAVVASFSKVLWVGKSPAPAAPAVTAPADKAEKGKHKAAVKTEAKTEVKAEAKKEEV